MQANVTRWRGMRLLAVVALVGAGLTAGGGAASAAGKDGGATVEVVMTAEGIDVQDAVDGRS